MISTKDQLNNSEPSLRNLDKKEYLNIASNSSITCKCQNSLSLSKCVTIVYRTLYHGLFVLFKKINVLQQYKLMMECWHVTYMLQEVSVMVQILLSKQKYCSVNAAQPNSLLRNNWPGHRWQHITLLMAGKQFLLSRICLHLAKLYVYRF